MKAWVTKHRLPTFFFLAFLWSWGWWLSLLFTTTPEAFATGNLPPTFFIFALVGGFGPSIAGIVTANIAGRDEAKKLSAGLKKARFSFVWYLFAFLTIPALSALQALFQALLGREVTFNIPAMMLVMAFIWPWFSSFGEEIGWRGFALPKLIEKFGTLKASLLLGVVWGFWHLPSDYIAYSHYGWLYILVFLVQGPINLTACAILMTFLYKKTGGSVLAMVIFHFTITLCGMLTPTVASLGQADDVLRMAVSVLFIVIPAALVAIFSKEMRGKELPQV